MNTFTSNKRPETKWFDRLNSSLQALVLSHLSDLELCGLSAVSKDWAALLQSAAVWRPVFRQHYADRAQGGKDAWYASSPELKLPTLSWRDACLLLARQKLSSLQGRSFLYTGKWESARAEPQRDYAMCTFSVVLTSQLGSDRVTPDHAMMPPDSMWRQGFEMRYRRERASALEATREHIAQHLSRRDCDECDAEVVEGYIDWTMQVAPTCTWRVGAPTWQVGDVGREFVLGYYHKGQRVLELEGFAISPDCHGIVFPDSYQLRVSADALSFHGVSRSFPPLWRAPICASSPLLQEHLGQVVDREFEAARMDARLSRMPPSVFPSMFE